MLSETESLSIAVANVFYLLLSSSMFIYGFIKWKQFYHHFLIAKRFASIINGVMVLSIISEIIGFTRRWLDYHTIVRDGTINDDSDIDHNAEYYIKKFLGLTRGLCSLIITSLIIYRMFLIYCQYNKSKSSKNGVDYYDTYIKNINNSRKIFIVYIVICSLFYYLDIVVEGVQVMVLSVLWMMTIIFGITAIIVIKCKKVTEGIKCLTETYILLILALIAVIISSMNGTDPPIFVKHLQIIIAPSVGLLSLYFTIYYIYKAEGTLNPEIWKNKHDSDMREHSKSVSRSISISDVPLPVFIKTEENYDMFFHYAAHCFAEESLYFIQNVSVLFQVIKNNCVDLEATDSNSQEVKIIFKPVRIQFLFLTDLYAKYKGVLNISDNEKISFDDTVRDALYKIIIESIYKVYIADDSEYEINISGECKEALQFYFEDENNKSKFKSFADIMTVFDEAICQIYRLLSSMYGYGFEHYISTHEQNN